MEEAEGKQRQSQEQLDGITQQLSELQSKCSALKAEVQRRNTILKSSEVSDQTVLAFSYHIVSDLSDFRLSEVILGCLIRQCSGVLCVAIPVTNMFFI